MKDSYLTAGIKVDHLFRLIRRNRITYSPRNCARLVFLFQSSCWSSLFHQAEKLRYSKKLRKVAIPEDPVFIIGHWRTGTTYLHQLFNLDPGLCTPTLFQVAIPDSFLISYPFLGPVLRRAVSNRRPMDQVRLGIDEPQEDEYALYRTADFSPLEKLVFPESKEYFLNHGTEFLPSGKQLERWSATLTGYFAKLHYATGQRIISKNPFNSFRIKTLSGLFPKAKFIHITRHPYDVVPSTVHMWRVVGSQNALNSDFSVPEVTDVVRVLKQLEETVARDSSTLPEGSILHIRFEDMETDPEGMMKNLYGWLGMVFTDEHKEKINRFNLMNKEFKKNTFTLKDEEMRIIAGNLEDHMKVCNYPINR